MRAVTATTDARRFEVDRLRADFPAFHQDVHDRPLVYLDSAATSLKPQVVIDTVADVYARDCANIHRAVHLLSQRATKRYEDARDKVRAFIHAGGTKEVVFVRGTTEGINLVAQSWGRTNLKEGDEIVLTGLEHHSNIVPWQLVAKATGAKLVVVPVTDTGEVPLDALKAKLGKRTKVVSTTHASNSLGTVLPVADIARLAHEHEAIAVVDGAQGAPHLAVDVAAIDCDFYAFSGHKLYGPTGIGVLYGKRALLEAMPPYEGGGDMIRSVTFEETLYNDLPYKFEAGTPNIAGAIGLGAAIDYVNAVGMDAIVAHEQALLRYGTEALSELEGLRLIGTAPHKLGVLSFVMNSAHPHDIGTIVDAEGVAIRTGHHCTQPLMERFGIAATARASFGLYNNESDIDALVNALGKVKELFG